MRKGTIGIALLTVIIIVIASLLPVAAQAASVIHVKPNGTGNGASWANAANLQDALTSGGSVTATSGDEIWLAAGTYYPGTSRDATFQLVEGVDMYGGFAGNETRRSQRDWQANETILSGDIGTPGDRADNSYHVVTGASNAIVDGMMITAGNADNDNYPDNCGAGIFNSSNSSPTLTNVIISGNVAQLNGGGIFNFVSSSPTLTNVIISGNRAEYGGGMFNSSSSSPTLTNVSIPGNRASRGGGIFNASDDSDPTIENSIIWGNIASDDPQVYSFSNSPDYDHSLVQDVDTGDFTGDEIPAFVSPVSANNAPTSDGDYRLQAGSPAIDAGSNSLIPFGIIKDLDGNARIQDGDGNNTNIVDLGAYEVQRPDDPGDPPDDPVHTVLLVYAGADNDLAADHRRMFANLEAAADNPHVKIIALLDGPRADDAAVYEIKHLPAAGFDPRLYNATNWSDDTANPEVLADFINTSLRAYPDAEQYLLVVSGHGSGISAAAPNVRPGRGSAKPDGTLSGILLDEHPQGASLSTAELGIALRDGLEGTGRTRFDGVYLDACLMGMIEVGYEIRDSANYLLASSHLKWSVFAYQDHIAAIDGQRNAREILKQWIVNERETLADTPHTYVLLNLRALDTLREALDTLVGTLDPAVVRQVATALDVYDQNGNFRLESARDSYVDIFTLLTALAEQPHLSPDAETQAAIQTTQRQLNVVVQAGGIQSGMAPTRPQFPWQWSDRAGGLSLYAPLVEDQWQRGQYTADNFRFAADSQWDEFLMAYWDQAAPAAPEPCTGGTCGPFAPLSVEEPAGAPGFVWLPMVTR